MIERLQNLLSTLIGYVSVVSILDILVSTILVYKIIGWLKGTQAYQVAKGILLFLLITLVTDLFGFVTLNYALHSFMTAGLVSVVIIFQPELRRALDSLGSARLFTNLGRNDLESIKTTVNEILEAMRSMSLSKTGAIIVIERDTQLGDIVETGVQIDAKVARSLLLNIFFPNSPMHDGAVIISSHTLKVRAAGCLLPLTQNRNLTKELGTRHRSAIGISENSDCISLVVSEETGTISYAINGSLSRYVDLMAIENILKETMYPQERSKQSEDKEQPL
ncbi:MAG: diadenylate cyclase CdaA [Eubacteriaceae bacterium]|nr:diadenylate cyclase CdaA [Eubacteriaceae bacterium]